MYLNIDKLLIDFVIGNHVILITPLVQFRINFDGYYIIMSNTYFIHTLKKKNPLDCT